MRDQFLHAAATGDAVRRATNFIRHLSVLAGDGARTRLDRAGSDGVVCIRRKNLVNPLCHGQLRRGIVERASHQPCARHDDAAEKMSVCG